MFVVFIKYYEAFTPGDSVQLPDAIALELIKKGIVREHTLEPNKLELR